MRFFPDRRLKREKLLDTLMAELQEAGLVFNANKGCFLIGPSNGMKSCTLGMNEQRISLVSKDSNVVLDLFWFVLEIVGSHC